MDWMTISGFLFLAAAIVRYSWISGDFTFFSWRPKRHNRKHGIPDYEEDPTRGMSYTEYRNAIREERKDMKNPYMASSLLILVISLILSLLYWPPSEYGGFFIRKRPEKIRSNEEIDGSACYTVCFDMVHSALASQASTFYPRWILYGWMPQSHTFHGTCRCHFHPFPQNQQM